MSHHRNPGMRVKVQFPLELSVENAEYLEATYGGEYRKYVASYRGYGTWIFSRVTEDNWKDFEVDIANLHGEIVQILKANPFGEMLVVAGANPRQRIIGTFPAGNLKKLELILGDLEEVLEKRQSWRIEKNSPLYYQIEWTIEELQALLVPSIYRTKKGG